MMENSCNGRGLDFPSVFEVTGEPAIVITGVPDVTTGSITTSLDTSSSSESDDDPCFDDWMEGRKIQKMFGDKHYFGKVEKYDSETKWYRVVYEDGDFEDLEWHELEALLLPLDISIPLTILAAQRCKSEKSMTQLSKRRNKHKNRLANKAMTVELLQTSKVGVEKTFSGRTYQETSQLRTGLVSENQETYFLRAKNNGSLSNAAEYIKSNTWTARELESEPVFEVRGEPTTDNSVPDATPGSTITIQETADNLETGDGSCLGECLEGRKVQKLFGDQYFLGKVEKYDKETKWYRVIYEDGDFEDLEWHELEQVLLPLDIFIPPKMVALPRGKLEKSPLRSRTKLAVRRKSHDDLINKEKTTELHHISHMRKSTEEKLLETNFGRTCEEAMQLPNGYQENHFLTCKNVESVSKQGEYTTIPNVCDRQELDNMHVYKVIGEPAVVINGVPDATPGYTSTIQDIVDNPELGHGPGFGEWLEGRMVQKFLGYQYYPGKVEKYDNEKNSYRVVYGDGNFEDLKWHDLEDLLVPLDISMPLTSLPSHLSKSKSSSELQRQLAGSRKKYTKEQNHISKEDEPRGGKLVEANAGSRIHQGNWETQLGLQIERIDLPGEVTITSRNNENEEIMDKMSNLFQTPARASMN